MNPLTKLAHSLFDEFEALGFSRQRVRQLVEAASNPGRTRHAVAVVHSLVPGGTANARRRLEQIYAMDNSAMLEELAKLGAPGIVRIDSARKVLLGAYVAFGGMRHNLRRNTNPPADAQ